MGQLKKFRAMDGHHSHPVVISGWRKLKGGRKEREREMKGQTNLSSPFGRSSPGYADAPNDPTDGYLMEARRSRLEVS